MPTSAMPQNGGGAREKERNEKIGVEGSTAKCNKTSTKETDKTFEKFATSAPNVVWDAIFEPFIRNSWQNYDAMIIVQHISRLPYHTHARLSRLGVPY